MSLCPYKNILGEPKKGVHSYRFMGLAIMDVIFTIIGAFIISYTTGYSFYLVLAILFLTGIVLHRLFCVRTTIDKILFPNAK
jgi:uncharacterized membrane protein